MSEVVSRLAIRRLLGTPGSSKPAARVRTGNLSRNGKTIGADESGTAIWIHVCTLVVIVVVDYL